MAQPYRQKGMLQLAIVVIVTVVVAAVIGMWYLHRFSFISPIVAPKDYGNQIASESAKPLMTASAAATSAASVSATKIKLVP